MRLVLPLLAVLVALPFAGCGEAEGQTVEPEAQASVEAATKRQARVDSFLAAYAGFEAPPRPPEAEAQAWADSALATLSLEQRVAQMFVVELGGVRDPDGLARLGVGGFHVHRRTPPREVLAATNRLQRAAPLPLLVAADFEWGVGTDASNFTSLPAAMAYGAADSEALTEAGGAVTALEARAIGVNVVWGPVADVNDNPLNPIINTRSFGGRPARVGALAAAFVRGLQGHGVLAALKHFPGHGNTDTDTHLDFASVPGDWDRLWRTELAPYRVALRERPGFVMSTHLWARALDRAATPATFSRRALSDVLRDSLGYDGLVTTDALNMGAVRKRYGFPDRVVLPVRAGADVVLFPPRPREGIRAVVAAVERGEIPRAQIDASARRVLLAKARLGLHRSRLADRDRLDRMLTTVRGADFARALSRASVTVVRDGGLPLAGRVALVQLAGFDAGGPMTRLERDLRPESAVRVTRRGSGAEAAAQAAARADVAVVALHLDVMQGRRELTAGQRAALRSVVAAGTPVVLVVLGNPYAAAALPEAVGVVVAYDPTVRTASAVADVLAGRQRATGRLPVEVPGLGRSAAGGASR